MARKITTEIFVNEARTIHGSTYNYESIKYISMKSPVKIFCPKHGFFLQRPDVHLYGKGCPSCGIVGYTLGTEKFIDAATNTHKAKYSYNNVNYQNNKLSVLITCPFHGDFKQTPDSHLRGRGCPICRDSSGERKVRQVLKDLSVTFARQFKFNDCILKRRLPFDFAILQNNVVTGLIEFNGVQHFDKNGLYAQNVNFDRIVASDAIKAKYCSDHKIPLLVIPYTESKNIKSLVMNFVGDIKCHHK